MKDQVSSASGVLVAWIFASASTSPIGEMIANQASQPIGGRYYPSELSASSSIRREPTVNQKKFKTLREQWQRETRLLSVVAMRYSHPAYQKILAIGAAAIPLILNELEKRPDRWFSALKALAGEEQDPTSPNDSFDSAVAKWLKWGRERGYHVRPHTA